MNRIVIGDRIVESFQRHDAGAGAGPRAACIGIERTAAAIRREDHPFLILVAGALRERDRDGARQRHVTFAAQQRLTCHLHRHQRGRAGRLDCHARPVQIELVRCASGEKILVVPDHQLIATNGRKQIAIRQQLTHEVRIETRSSIDADSPAFGLTGVAGMLERFPRAFQKDALLRINDLCFARRVAEKRGVEVIRVFEQRAARHPARKRTNCSVHTGCIELGLAEIGE